MNVRLLYGDRCRPIRKCDARIVSESKRSARQSNGDLAAIDSTHTHTNCLEPVLPYIKRDRVVDRRRASIFTKKAHKSEHSGTGGRTASARPVTPELADAATALPPGHARTSSYDRSLTGRGLGNCVTGQSNRNRPVGTQVA